MIKLLLIDLDGTVRVPASGSRFIDHPHNQRIILGSAVTLAQYHEQGWLIVGITNQGGVAAGHKQLEDAIVEQRYTLKLIPQMEGVYFCPDFEGNHCWLVGRVHDDGKPVHLAPWASEFVGSFRKPQRKFFGGSFPRKYFHLECCFLLLKIIVAIAIMKMEIIIYTLAIA